MDINKFENAPHISERPSNFWPGGIGPGEPLDSDEISLNELWRVLYRRRWIVVLAILGCVVAAATYCVLVKPRYTATARISIDPDKPDTLNLQDLGMNIREGGDAQSRIETEVRILQSDTLALAVIEKLKLYKNPAFGNFVGQIDTQNPRLRSQLLRSWRSGLTVNSIPKTNLVEVSFRSKSAEMSAAAVNGLIDAYVERNFRVKYESTMQASDWLSRQLEDIKTKSTEAEEKLTEYQKKSGILVWGQNNTTNLVTDSMQELNKALTAAQTDRIVKEARYRVALSGDPKAMADLVPGSPLAVLRTQHADLLNQYAQATAKYGSAYPKVRQLKAQLDQVAAATRVETKNLITRFKDEYEASRRSESMLLAQMETRKAEAFKFNEGAVQLQILQREAQSNRDLYEGLLKKLKEAGVIAGLKSTNINVVDYASVPADPSDPKVRPILLLGLGSGVLLGLALAFIRENLKDTLNNPDEAESYSGLPLLVAIPMIGGEDRRSLLARATQKALPEDMSRVTLDRPKSHAAEAFRALRTSILLSRADAAPKTIVITSSSPGEGKSTISLNTAIVLAQEDARVLLIDADMRRSTLHRKLGIQGHVGLSTVLTNATGLKDAIVQIEEVKGLFVLPAGPPPPYPAELLRSRTMKQLFETCRAEFDFIVIDTPPVLTLTDAVVVAANADATILVMRSGQIGRQALRRSRNTLFRANANIVGLAVNAIDTHAPDYHYYHYGNYYETAEQDQK